MGLLILGIIIWSLIHFYPAAAVRSRAGLVQRLGKAGYRAVFTLVAIGALLLIIYGWKAAPLDSAYAAPAWGIYATAACMLAAFVLLFAPYISNSISLYLRHPQLAGVFLFGVGHLFANGEIRSVLLFGGFAAWALLEMLLLNRRDGAWKKPDSKPAMANLRLLLTGIGFFAIVMYLHGWLFGADVMAYWQT
jgi:uncharacterized membrane protein